MSVNWNNLRSWNGSQDKSFEELCCQLAASESIPKGSRFFRKGTPDAGVECFWRLPSGEEWGWQAKYFHYAPGQTQWKEMNESVTTAISKHPNLVKYTICLPIDRSDARNDNQKTMMMKWDEHVEKWQQFAISKGMSISFEYWGQSELATRLSSEHHRGRHWFWFKEECFSNSWFSDRVDEAVANARDRYSPDINIDLPIRSNLEALGRTPVFFSHIDSLYSNACTSLRDLRSVVNNYSLINGYEQIFKLTSRLFNEFLKWVKRDENYQECLIIAPIDWENIHKLSEQLLKEIQERISIVRELIEIRRKEDKESNLSSDENDYQLHRLYDFYPKISKIVDFSESINSKLSNNPAFLLLGRAGQGKTHLLCHTAKCDSRSSMPRLLFHGEQFRNEEPWSQIIQLSGLNCSHEEFLGALEAAGQANNCRILIFIDALNEGEGNRLWVKFLAGMLTTLARYKWLGVCLSVRSEYEKYIIPETLDESKIIRQEHIGFGDLAYEAVEKFFSHFGIEPSTPVLLPEFNNPLFLKLLCQSLQKEGLTRVPTGLHGITTIFNFFISSVDRKLSRQLDYDTTERITAKAIESLADEMAKRRMNSLPLDESKKIVNAFLKSDSYEKSLFRNLESEGVLTVIPDYWRSENQEFAESVRFTYQRFSDHMITKRLLEQHFDIRNPKKSFSSKSYIGKMLKDEQTCSKNSGIIEALSIQLPELYKKELPDLVPHIATLHIMREAFIESIVWRNSKSFSPSTDKYIDEQVFSDKYTFETFWDRIISLSTIPDHPFNADRLHDHLYQFELADRDEDWSILLHELWGTGSAVDRLINWAWEDNDKSRFDDEVIRLAGITLAWFFTTANRFLRDRATKAMVRLCERRISVLCEIIEQFTGVNDPYVSERLFAVAYGCAMRTNDYNSMKALAEDIYRLVFESGEPPPHILLRDYARGVIEITQHRGIQLDIDIERVRSPYHSDWPSIVIKEADELKKWGEWKDEMPDKNWAQVSLYGSVMGDTLGDFSHYVISGLHEWSSWRIGDQVKPTHKELHDEFLKSLTKRQKEAWDSYISIKKNIEYYRSLEPEQRKEVFKKEFGEEELESLLISAKLNFENTLSRNSKKKTLFSEEIELYVSEPSRYYHEGHFDGQLARRWMITKIIEMGWTVDRFGSFDRNVNRYSMHGREPNKPERIGKKYQWIVFHELLGRLSDNFRLFEDEWSDRSIEYHGPWNIGHRRDIDPSNLLKSTSREDRLGANRVVWWFTEKIESWKEPVDDIKWMKNNSDLPSVKNIIQVTNPENRDNWLTFKGFYEWEQPVPPGEKRFEKKGRNLWYILRCYLVKKVDSIKLLK